MPKLPEHRLLTPGYAPIPATRAKNQFFRMILNSQSLPDWTTFLATVQLWQFAPFCGTPLPFPSQVQHLTMKSRIMQLERWLFLVTPGNPLFWGFVCKILPFVKYNWYFIKSKLFLSKMVNIAIFISFATCQTTHSSSFLPVRLLWQVASQFLWRRRWSFYFLAFAKTI